MNFKHLQEESYAIDFLADHLIDGTLVLFLGAGTSRGFGLPDWLDLANSFRTKVGLAVISGASSPELIQNAIDEALDIINNDAEKKVQLLQEILYPDPREINVTVAFSNHLLIAISSLLIGSKRGHVRRVVTFNYDSMLEWFLSLFGFQVNSIVDLPALEGSEDVRLYHPHGFVPHPTLGLQGSKIIILGLKDANLRSGRREDLWRDKLRQIIETGVCLFIGLSGNTLSDRAVSGLLATAGEDFKDQRPLGIWISYDTLTKEKKGEFFRNNIVPLEITEEIKISEFILKISQKALEKQTKF